MGRKAVEDVAVAYFHLEVTLASGLSVVDVDVHQYRDPRTYRAPRPPGGPPPARDDFDVFDGLDRGWDPLWARIQRATKKQFGAYGRVVEGKWAYGAYGWMHHIEPIDDYRELRRVYEGKGSPGAIQQALRLANLYGLVEGNRTALQAYCDAFIGLDGTGFVGNVLRENKIAAPGATLFDTPERPPLDFAPPAKQVRRLASVRPGNIIVWTDGSQIAIIDDAPDVGPRGATSMEVMVYASTAGSGYIHSTWNGGLWAASYLIKPTSVDTVFQVAGHHQARPRTFHPAAVPGGGDWDEGIEWNTRTEKVFISDLGL
jgi:hypothetical protein